MKNKLLFTIIPAFIGLITVASAQNVTIPDAKFKAALVGNKAINTNSDTEIQVSEAAAYKGAIIVGSLSIADLTGIEAFTGIDSLNCHINNLKSVNISACKALKYFNCDYNQLTSLNVSSNTLLTGLNCTNNPLTSLDVSSNTLLTGLGCGGNHITSLDVSHNKELVGLVCFYDSIGSLDVSALTKLTYFDCSYNKLTSLNMKYGNNSNLIAGYGFNAKHNSNLTCIQVDDSAYMTANKSGGKDATAHFSANCHTTGIADMSNDDKITIYPNPFSSQTTLLTSNPFHNATLTICNSLGQSVKQIKNISGQSVTVFRDNLPKGLYFLRFT
ncbi:MAG: T9SS type A sorting domain-containing protein, partial [Bacteroidetes bacterium]|nr:T9SS type A sorting domain-containing protein [Bacteroidota bacterium]